MSRNRSTPYRQQGFLALFLVCFALLGKDALPADEATLSSPRLPRVIATWGPNQKSCEVALRHLQKGQSRLDAVEQGVRVAESDIEDRSVGIGGMPNAAGVVQLDACIMDGVGHRAGSVAALEDILHPISVARLVMEKTPHVMLVGQGAQQFALAHGLSRRDLLIKETRAAWMKWSDERRPSSSNPPVDAQPENHDTIALAVVDASGNLAGGCSTSGWGYKLPGRVGDSPILGGGLYVDNEVGAAGATGTGENVMRFCGSFMVVEAMRQGATPSEACRSVVRTIIRKDPQAAEELHINFMAIDREGRIGAAGTDRGFDVAVADENGIHVIQAQYITEPK